MDIVRPALRMKMQKYGGAAEGGNNIRFSLLAIVDGMYEKASDELEFLKRERDSIERRMKSGWQANVRVTESPVEQEHPIHVIGEFAGRSCSARVDCSCIHLTWSGRHRTARSDVCTGLRLAENEQGHGNLGITRKKTSRSLGDLRAECHGRQGRRRV